MSTPSINFNDLSKLLPIYAHQNLVPFLAGEPGIGKSAVVKSLADKFHTKVFVLSVNQLGTREDLTGARSIKDEETGTYRQIFFPHAIIQEAIDYAKAHPTETPFLFLDEINRTSPDVTSAILALITERRVGTTNLPDNIRIIAAGNDHGNVNNLDTASITRMAIFHVEPDVADFIEAQPDLNFYIKQLLQQHPDLLVQTQALTTDNTDDDADDDDDDPLSTLNELDDISGMQQLSVPRTLTYTSQFLNEIGLNGQSLPDDLNTIYNPMEPENSPLYKGLYAQLGNTETLHVLITNLADSIEKLTTMPQTAQTPTHELPKPTKQILEQLAKLQSVDDENQYFTTYLNDDSESQTDQITKLANTFFSAIRPEFVQTLPSQDIIQIYYQFLATNYQLLPKDFTKNLLTILQLPNSVPSNLLLYMKNAQDEYSVKHVQPLMNALGINI